MEPDPKGSAWERTFIRSVGVVLLVTAVAKLFSAAGTAKYLLVEDPIFRLPFRDLFIAAGTIEILIAVLCLLSPDLKLAVGMTMALSTAFVCYHIGLVWLHYTRPCRCLGNLTDALHLPPAWADVGIKAIVIYMALGSFACAARLTMRRRRLMGPSAPGPLAP
jgi:methylamine utilization protein MauE